MSRLTIALALSAAAHLALLLMPAGEEDARPAGQLSVQVQMPALADGSDVPPSSPARPSPPAPAPATEALSAPVAPVPESTVPAPDTANQRAKPAPGSEPASHSYNAATTEAQRQQWLAQLRQHIAGLTRYPSRARLLGQEGIVIVSFRVSKDGSVSAASISQPSPFSLLDQAALAVLQGPPMPPPPASLAGSLVTVPVVYRLQGATASDSSTR